jgi:antitoxin VapB
MALSIKNDTADRLARELADATGESITDAIVVALQERLDRVRRLPGIGERLERLSAEVGSYPVVDSRTVDEILDYDGSGLP